MNIRVRKIKNILLEKNMTQKDFAKELEMHPAYLSRIMTEDIKVSDKVMQKISTKFDIPLYLLIDDTTNTISETKQPTNPLRKMAHDVLDEILNLEKGNPNENEFYRDFNMVLLDLKYFLTEKKELPCDDKKETRLEFISSTIEKKLIKELHKCNVTSNV